MLHYYVRVYCRSVSAPYNCHYRMTRHSSHMSIMLVYFINCVSKRIIVYGPSAAHVLITHACYAVCILTFAKATLIHKSISIVMISLLYFTVEKDGTKRRPAVNQRTEPKHVECQ
jgi:hypothetical protein